MEDHIYVGQAVYSATNCTLWKGLYFRTGRHKRWSDPDGDEVKDVYLVLGSNLGNMVFVAGAQTMHDVRRLHGGVFKPLGPEWFKTK